MNYPRYLALVGFAIVLLLVAPARWSVAQKGQRRAGLQLFERHVRPVLVKHCYECHSAEADELGGDLLLDSRAGARQGGQSGPAVVPGDASASLLLSAVRYRDFEMPPDEQLPEDTIRLLRRWIEMGAPDPRDGSARPVEAPQGQPAEKAALWSLQPIRAEQAPSVSNQSWPRSEVDRFVLHRLESADLKPVADAPPTALLRRVYFDLIGLPPPADEVARASAGLTDAAYARLVDRLLKLPQFGERWGRHWLDVVRYGESAGNSRDVLMPYAWRYRDYVIDALNSDLPYDRFLTEQIAGDLLDAGSAAAKIRQQIATGLLAVGSKSLNGGNLELDLVDDQIDVISRASMGLTVSCARCHDHKFDPIPTRDYYALAGIFRSTETLYGGGIRRPKSTSDKLKVYLALTADGQQQLSPKQIDQHEKQMARLEKEKSSAATALKRLRRRLPEDYQQRLEQLQSVGGSPRQPSADERLVQQVAELDRREQRLRKIEAQIDKLQRTAPASVQLAIGAREAAKITDSPVHIRGDRRKTGEKVDRGFLSCVSLSSCQEVPEQSSGRLQLAQWLTHPEHPLTARVAVNRVWHHLFGRGLVETVDNFGTNGARPTHPQLLDYLAYRFIDVHRWSIKSLIRELVSTRTYRLSSQWNQDNYARDPANQLYWRMSRRRLEAEPIRDAMLAASGQLDLRRPAGSLVSRMGEGEWGRGVDLTPLEQPFPHRSVYLPIIRGHVPEFLKLFDLPEPSNPQGARDTTNVPTQSLFLLNSPLVMEQARGLAQQLIGEQLDAAGRLDLAYRTCLSRPPRPDEVQHSQATLRRLTKQLARQKLDEGQLRLRVGRFSARL